jgi:hypothetical protein
MNRAAAMTDFYDHERGAVGERIIGHLRSAPIHGLVRADVGLNHSRRLGTKPTNRI